MKVIGSLVIDHWLKGQCQQPIRERQIYLLHLGLVLSGGEGGRITFLLQIDSHELIDGQLTGGCVLKLC